MWTQQQRYCTACAAASLLGFVALALYLDPTGMTRLNPFRGEDCRTYEQQRPFNEQQQTDKKVSSNEGGEPSAEQHARNAAAQAPEHQGSEADYYACRLAIYTHQLALFTGALVVVTVILIGTGIYQGVHLSRAANAAKDSADALPVLERSYVFMEIDPTSIAELWSILRQSVKPDDIVIRYRYINHGKTPAIIKAISATFTHLSELPTEIRYIDFVNIGEIIIAAGKPYPAPQERRFPAFMANPARTWVEEFRYEERLSVPIDATAITSIKNGQSFLWFYGHIVYDDVFAMPHETAFCWRFDGTTGTFNRCGEKYNYRT